MAPALSPSNSPTVLVAPSWKTVAPGPHRFAVSLLDGTGCPVSGATVMATGDVAGLPARLPEEEPGRYSATIEIPADADGMRRVIEIRAHGHNLTEVFATSSFFIEDPGWIVRNDHVKRQLDGWAKLYPELLALEAFTTYEGYATHAVSLTNQSVADADKKKLLFLQSHGHEPAGTAAIMEFLHQLLTGSSQAGGSALARERILDELLLVFVPIGNASGRERCPVQCWEDQYDSHTLNCFIYGKLKDDPEPWTRSPSVLDRSRFELDPAFPMPLRYEQIDEDLFVEPFFAMLPPVPGELPFPSSRFGELLTAPEDEPGHRTALGYFVKSFLDRYEFTTAVDLHQMTKPGDSAMVFARSEARAGYNAASLRRTDAIASRIEADWLANGWKVGEEGRRRLTLDDEWPLNITDFIHLYGKGNPASFMVEVTKGPGTKKKMQMALTLSAITSAVDCALD